MTDVTEPRSTLAERLHALAAPVREEFERVEEELRVAEVLVHGLRAELREARTALRAVDPTYEPETKPKKRKGAGTYGVSSDTLDEMAELMRKNVGQFNGKGFTCPELHKLPGWHWSMAHTSQAIRAMHDRGMVRLDGVAGGPKNNAKTYRLV